MDRGSIAQNELEILISPEGIFQKEDFYASCASLGTV